MAAKLNLLLEFANGQGIIGGLPEYSTYPTDHDTNYASIQTSVNQIIDEVASANLFDSQIQLDIYLADGAIKGRATVEDAQIRFTSNTVTITNGIIFNGGRITVQANTFDFSVLANDTYLISVDRTSGVLSNTVSPALPTQNVLIATVVFGGVIIAANITDDLFLTTGHLKTGESLDKVEKIYDVNHGDWLNGDAARPDKVDPPIGRWKDTDGTLGDGGFFALNENSGFGWVSRREDGVGSGLTVIAGGLRDLGQLQLYTQARLTTVSNTATAFVPTSTIDIVWDDMPTLNTDGDREQRREPEVYFSEAWYGPGSDNDLQVPAGGPMKGTYMWTLYVDVNLTPTTATSIQVQLRATNAPSTIFAREKRDFLTGADDVAFTISGMIDLSDGDNIQAEVILGAGTGNATLNFARISCLLIAGGQATFNADHV